MEEKWMDIEGYEGLYQVSSEGRVRSLNYRHTGQEKLLKPTKTRGDYLQVGLWKEGKRKWYKVHRLVYEAFNGEIPDDLQINHIDEDKENNSLDNLNLMTPKENNNWGTHNERVAKTLTNNPNMSKPVVGKDKQGNILYIFPSTQEAGRNGFGQSHIAACCRGELKKHKGLYWNYV